MPPTWMERHDGAPAGPPELRLKPKGHISEDMAPKGASNRPTTASNMSPESPFQRPFLPKLLLSFYNL